MSERNIFPFTLSQWQELEHQALIFNYMVSGIPIPPDLLFTVKRSCLDSSLSSRLFSRQPQHIGWNCFRMGLGRKVDPEPRRCRRTDGKKWRCSKEAYPDSKYCERHMHRGKNRSRKPVEITTTTANPSTATPPNISSITKSHAYSFSSLSSTSLSSSESQQHHHQLRYHGYHSQLDHPFMYPYASRPPGIGLSPQENTTHSLMDSSSFSQTNADYSYVYGLKEEVDEHAFFSEPSGTMRSFSGSSVDDSWQRTPLTMSSSSSKQRSCSGLQSDYSCLQLQSFTDHTSKQNKQDDEHCYVLGSDIKCEMPIKLEKGEPQKIVHRFFDEWPPKQRDSWLDLDDKSSNSSSVSTTRLSISTPSTLHDFPIFSSRAHNGILKKELNLIVILLLLATRLSNFKTFNSFLFRSENINFVLQMAEYAVVDVCIRGQECT
ncbi:growth-regulating factor 1 isoform X2 [Durio zibethinus]|uniref:Growth-regulating factor n=1 Tax=Durio zibethinus TaxID=66656 RepID=A0A6P5ZFX6_DURZI|nr:growth-regulating factor 1 isoform X2 [Durio zibethinus]